MNVTEFQHGNTTPPPENFRFIPGWTPGLKNVTSPTGKTAVFNGTGYYIEDEFEPGNYKERCI